MKLLFYPYNLQLQHVFTVAACSRTFTPGVQVEIECDGVTGYGEASMPPYLGESTESVVAFMNKIDLKPFNDPFKLEDILAYVDSVDTGNTVAKAAIDIALHDVVGKLMKMPWYKIWGLDKEKAPLTTYTVGIDTPERMQQKIEEVAGRFRLLKVKLGSGRDREIMEAIRRVTSLPIAVDANQGWKDRYEAMDMIRWLETQNVVMIEQPMPKETDLDDIAWLSEQTSLPIFADESVRRLADVERLKGAFTGVNIKLMKCTGMREAWKMLTLARALGMKVMVGCMTETSCAVSAAAQLSPAADFADLDGNLLISNDLFEGMEVVDGKITLNDLPGIGVRKRLI